MATTTVQQSEASEAKLDPMRHHTHYGNGKESSYAGGSSFMERVSEGVASGMGTVGFLLVSSGVIVAWVLSNHVVHFLGNSWEGLLKGKGFDPAPFILLNLVFSAVAFYTGALVIIAQKAQTRTDKANEEAAARHRDEIARYQEAATERRDQLIQMQADMLQRNTALTEEIHALSQQLSTLTQEVHEATCPRPGSAGA